MVGKTVVERRFLSKNMSYWCGGDELSCSHRM